jgi:signal transduction histidine kinase
MLVQLGYSQTLGGIPTLLALYTCAVRARFALGLAVAVTTLAAIGVVLLTAPFEPSTGDWIANTLVVMLGWSFGRSVRNRRARTASIDARDEAIAAAETAHRHAAELQRRAELAQELQDLVAHSLTQITVQLAGARRTLDKDPDLAKQTLTDAEVAGRAAMQEMRLLFDVLKSSADSALLAPTPTLADLDQLVASHKAPGVQVDLSVPAALEDVPAGVGLTVYRIVEEALMNAHQHARARDVEVQLGRSADLLCLRVIDSGDQAPPRWDSDPTPGDSPDRGGNGLRRLQARVSLYGGRLTWRHRRDGGFVLRAEVPITVPGGLL